MTEPIYTTASILTSNSANEDYVPYLIEFCIERYHMLVNSKIQSTTHPQFSRHWTNADDAQAWVDAVHEFAAKHNFDIQGRVEPI